MILTVIFGTLAALAFLATCRDEYLRWTGLWLVAGWLISNVLFYGHVTPSQRVGPYTAIEIMVAVAATWALAERSRWLIAILCFNLISIAANIGLAVNFSPNQQQIYWWDVTTNLCFTGECLFAFGIGVAHGVGRFRRRVFIRGGAAQSGAPHSGAEA